MHIQIAGLEIDLLPPQRHEFRGAVNCIAQWR
jgi:hypothetical protein